MKIQKITKEEFNIFYKRINQNPLYDEDFLYNLLNNIIDYYNNEVDTSVSDNFSDINYIHKNKKLVFLVEKKEVTFVSDLFTKEELNLTKDLYNNVILKVDEGNLLVRVTDTDDPTLTREEGDRDIISLVPTYLKNEFISSPYFGYPKVSNAIIPIEKYEDKDVIMLPTSIILETETKSLFDEGINLSDDDVFGKYKNNFKEFMVKEKVATKEIGNYFKDKVECSYFDLDKIKEFVYYTNN